MKNIMRITLGIFLVFTIVSCREKEKSPEAEKLLTISDVDTESLWPPDLGDVPVELAEDMLKKNYYIIFDGSGSMDGSKLITAKKALSAFISQIPDEANIGMLVFDENGISERVMLSHNRDILKKEIQAVSANHGTPLKSSIAMAYKSLLLQGHRQQGYGEYHLVIVTDGEASSGEDPGSIVDVIIRESPVLIHTLGFKIGENHSLNQPGRVLYKSASNLDELMKGLEEVLAESEDFSVSNF